MNALGHATVYARRDGEGVWRTRRTVRLDAEGRKKFEWDGGGDYASFSYDALSRLEQVGDGERGETRYVYANGNPVMNMDWMGLFFSRDNFKKCREKQNEGGLEKCKSLPCLDCIKCCEDLVETCSEIFANKLFSTAARSRIVPMTECPIYCMEGTGAMNTGEQCESE